MFEQSRLLQLRELSASYEQCYAQLQAHTTRDADATSKEQRQLAQLREHLQQVHLPIYLAHSNDTTAADGGRVLQ